MSEARRKITLEVDLEDNTYKKIIVNQYESVTLVMDVLKVENFTVDKLTINFSNPRGETVPIEDGTVTSNGSKFTIKFPRSCFEVEGSALCQLCIRNSDNFKFSFPIQVIIIKSAVGNGTFKGDDIIKTLKDTIAEATKINNQLIAEKASVESCISSIQSAKFDAEREISESAEVGVNSIVSASSDNLSILNREYTDSISRIRSETSSSINKIKAAGTVDAAVVSQNSADIAEIKDKLLNQNWFWSDEIMMQDIHNLHQLRLDWEYFKERYDYYIGGEGEEIIKRAFDVYYPVGSLYISTKPENPSSNFSLRNTKWEEFGQGRVLVGAGTGKDVNNVSKTFNAGSVGGEYNHSLTVDELARHSHLQYVGANSGEWGVRADYDADSNCGAYPQGETDKTGNGQGHNNIQPYVTVYIWKRTE